MIKTSLFVLAIAVASSSASAMPLMYSPASTNAYNNVLTAKVVCEQDGHCYQRGRPPVARWVYGDGAFYGPDVGPGDYGRPGRHWAWWAFLGF